MNGSNRFSSNVLPPWLWVWMPIFVVVVLPYFFAVWVRNIQQLLATPIAGIDWVTNTAYRILGLPALLELIPSLALFLGLVALLRPQLRTQYLEQKYKLKPISYKTHDVAKILEFIEHHAPGIEVRANFRRTDQVPFVYPLGFRKTAIALFGQLVTLWRADRPAAEAILLHELAHYRHGDALIIGAGSPFRAVIEQWGRFFVWLFVLPFVLSFAAITILFFWEIGQIIWIMGLGGIGMLFQAIVHKLGQSVFMLIGALIISIGLLMWTTSVFVVPMVAIWCSELNADQAPAGRSQEETLNALRTLPEETSGRQWILFRLAHPPARLRQWMVAHSRSNVGRAVLLLLFPLSFVIQVILLRLLSGLASIQGIQLVPMERVAGWETMAGIWVVAAVLLGIWPFIAAFWEKLFCNARREDRLDPVPYWISAGVLVMLVLLV